MTKEELLSALPECIKVVDCSECGALVARGAMNEPQWVEKGLRSLGGYVRGRARCAACFLGLPLHPDDRRSRPEQAPKIRRLHNPWNHDATGFETRE